MKIITKGGTDKTVIMGVRESLFQGFNAGDWLDLRVGFFLSLTKAANDDDPTSISETIPVGSGGVLGAFERYWIGLTSATGNLFIGYTNRGDPNIGTNTTGSSMLVSSDIEIGTTNAFFWRPRNGTSNVSYVGGILESLTGQQEMRVTGRDGIQIHLPQDTTGAGGYAVLYMFRVTRDNLTTGRYILTVTSKTALAGHFSGDVLYTNTPTATLLQTNLESFPANVQTWGPVQLSNEPAAMYFYWPFHSSRLRIHAAGVLRAG